MLRKSLLMSGIGAALVYVGTDIIASLSYPGFSFTDQAVSELFAIGAPTSALVASLFSLSSVLLLAFALGVWRSPGSNRALRLAALMFAGSACVQLLLWNAFPMHMRGAERTFTDTMHLILASNPFVLLSLVAVIAALGGAFRYYSVATLLILVGPAIFAFQYAPHIDAGLATPGLGLAERVSQYGYMLWQSALAVFLLRKVDDRLTRSPPLKPAGG